MKAPASYADIACKVVDVDIKSISAIIELELIKAFREMD